jgi:outer membrane protein OmpA-like peptidoglycan-associated protein
MQRTPNSTLVVMAVALVAFPALAGETAAAADESSPSISLEAFGGGHFFAEGANLGVASAPEATAGAHSNAALGVRASIGIGPWLAAEAELLGMMTTDRTYQRQAGILGYRLNAIAYVLPGKLRPFILVGAGPMQVVSTKAEGKAGLVRDLEGEFHVGLGLSYRVIDHLALRADVRAVQMPGKQLWSLTADFEAMAGVSFIFGAGPRAAAPAVQALPPPPPLAPVPVAPVPVAPVPVAPVPVAPVSSAPAVAIPAPTVPVPAAPASPPAAPAAPVVQVPAPPSQANRTSPAAPAAASVSSVKELLARAKELKFEGSGSKLSLVSLPLLGELAEAMVKEPSVQLEIVSHTAGSGDEKKDMALSKRRADAVKNALVEREVPANRVTATGRGSEEPLAPNITRSGRKLNERMELRFPGADKPSR